MYIRHAHAWAVSPKEAQDIQRRLAALVETHDRFPEVRHVAGVDVGFEENKTVTRAAVAVLSFPDLTLQEYAIARRPTAFPYVPGLLSFREVPAVLDALERLRTWPEVILCDGQGVAHPRRFGIASHLGVLLDQPTVGVAKTRLVGKETTPPQHKGAWTPLTDKGATIGAVLRTRQGVRPVYVSAGHRVSLETAVSLVMACVTRYRLPETTRWADRIASNRGGGFST